jgi:hypothetical protein
VRLVVVNGLLLLAAGLAILSVIVVDRAEASVEAAVRHYALAISSGDLDGALDEVVPARREIYRDWLSTQLGNGYDVRGIAVRSPALFDRLVRGAPRGPTEVSVVLDVNRHYPDVFYQPTARVPVEQVDGRWYLSQPLLAHE